MTRQKKPFFLFLGSSDHEGATSKMKAAGWDYKKKMLESKPDNWESVFEYIDRPDLSGILIKLTATAIQYVSSPAWEDVAGRLFSRIQHLSHIIFIHQSFFSDLSLDEDDADPSRAMSEQAEDIFFDTRSDPPSARWMFGGVPDELKERAKEFLDGFDLNIVPYSRNAELTVIATSFIDENERDLIFRLYVPNDRMWASESGRLLQLFRDYLARVSGLSVRQDQYSTNQGVIYELFGDTGLASVDLSKEFSDFSRFLDVCVANPENASRTLAQKSITNPVAYEIVERYAKEAKRLHIDLKHERERRILAIRHRMESELVDVISTQAEWDEVNHVIALAVPQVGAALSVIGLGANTASSFALAGATINIRPQIITSVHGMVAHYMAVNVRQNFCRLCTS